MLQTKLKPKLCCGMASQLSHSKSSELFSAMGHPCAHSHHNSSHLSNYLLRYKTMNSGNNRREHTERSKNLKTRHEECSGEMEELCAWLARHRTQRASCEGTRRAPQRPGLPFALKDIPARPDTAIFIMAIFIKKKKKTCTISHKAKKQKTVTASNWEPLPFIIFHMNVWEGKNHQQLMSTDYISIRMGHCAVLSPLHPLLNSF